MEFHFITSMHLHWEQCLWMGVVEICLETLLKYKRNWKQLVNQSCHFCQRFKMFLFISLNADQNKNVFLMEVTEFN
jgi:hypothetical protein